MKIKLFYILIFFFTIVNFYPIKLIKAEENTKFEKTYEIFSESIKCQSAFAVTSQYTLVFMAFKTGIEQSNDYARAKEFLDKIKSLWKNYENLVVIAKSTMKEQYPAIDFNEKEEKIFKEGQTVLYNPLTLNNVDAMYFKILMKINSDCFKNFNSLKKNLEEITAN